MDHLLSEMFGEFRDAMTETMFLNTYGSPLLQSLVGLGVQQATPCMLERDLVREAHEARLRAELEGSFDVGGLEEAALRALIYIRLADGSIDERGFAVLKQIRASRPAGRRISLARFKEILREQYLLVCLDEERALGAVPSCWATTTRHAKRHSMSCIGSLLHAAACRTRASVA